MIPFLPIQKSTISDIEINIPIIKIDPEKRLVYGWASIIEKDGQTVIDHHGDIIDEDELVKAAQEFMSEYRRGDEMHLEKGTGQIVESLVFTKEVQKALGVDLGKVGWFIVYKVINDSTWDKVKNGDYKDFSFGGQAIREEISA